MADAAVKVAVLSALRGLLVEASDEAFAGALSMEPSPGAVTVAPFAQTRLKRPAGADASAWAAREAELLAWFEGGAVCLVCVSQDASPTGLFIGLVPSSRRAISWALNLSGIVHIHRPSAESKRSRQAPVVVKLHKHILTQREESAMAPPERRLSAEASRSRRRCRSPRSCPATTTSSRRRRRVIVDNGVISSVASPIWSWTSSAAAPSRSTLRSGRRWFSHARAVTSAEPRKRSRQAPVVVPGAHINKNRGLMAALRLNERLARRRRCSICRRRRHLRQTARRFFRGARHRAPLPSNEGLATLTCLLYTIRI